MEVATLEAEIAEVLKDIKSLQQEIDPLNEQYETLCEELKVVEESIGKSEVNKVIQTEHAGSKAHNYDDTIPPLVQHNHFDDSIAKFFTESFQNGPKEPTTHEPTKKKQKLSEFSYNLLEKSTETAEIKENILYENIFRFGGVTAFPINNTLFKDDDEILGIRFDVFSHFTKKFLAPHYIILKKLESNTKSATSVSKKWFVYRHTIPVYISLEEYDHFLVNEEDIDLGLRKFVYSLRDHLIQIQYKHDQFDALSQLSMGSIKNNDTQDPVFAKIDKDLECNRVILHITDKNNPKQLTHEIELICTNNMCQSVTVRLTGNKSDQFERQINLIESILTDIELKNMKNKMVKALSVMVDELII